MRRDQALQPKKAGTTVTGFGFIGPGGRVTLDHRTDIEAGSSQLSTKLRTDANFGFAGVSGHADLQLVFLFLGASAGYRYSWHMLEFEPGADGLDHGESELNRKARIAKDEDDDFTSDTFGWAEGRARLVLPFGPNFTALTTAYLRGEDRPDNSYSWEFATVYDSGLLVNWETLLFFRDRQYGFIGPTVRLLDLPRAGERAKEFHYGIAAGTTPGWSEAPHTLVLRVYTNAGFDDELMGTHTFRIPIHLILGYRQGFEL